MATTIRLKRGGRTHAPYYRVVVMDSRNRTRGREIEQVGVYHPCARPEPIIDIDAEKVIAWLGNGVQMSDTVRSVLSKKGILQAFASGTPVPTDTPVAPDAPVEAAQAVEEAPAAEEAPAEDAPAEEAADA